MDKIYSFWEALSSIERIFWFVAIHSTLIMIIQLVLTFVGGDSDTDTVGDSDLDTGEGLQFFTFKNLVAFFTIFSWVGLGCLKTDLHIGFVFLISFFSGLLMMFIMSGLFYLISKMASNGTMNIQNAIGKTGEVYLTIPASKKGLGKVSLIVQGSLRELNALTNDQEDIKTGELIVVTHIENNILIVKRFQ